jgi:hypothetical protein
VEPITIRRTILQQLATCQPLALPQPTLYLLVIQLLPGVSATMLIEETSWLLDHGFVRNLSDPLDPKAPRKWFLTELGQQYLLR